MRPAYHIHTTTIRRGPRTILHRTLHHRRVPQRITLLPNMHQPVRISVRHQHLRTFTRNLNRPNRLLNTFFLIPRRRRRHTRLNIFSLVVRRRARNLPNFFTHRITNTTFTFTGSSRGLNRQVFNQHFRNRYKMVNRGRFINLNEPTDFTTDLTKIPLGDQLEYELLPFSIPDFGTICLVDKQITNSD